MFLSFVNILFRHLMNLIANKEKKTHSSFRVNIWKQKNKRRKNKFERNRHFGKQAYLGYFILVLFFAENNSNVKRQQSKNGGKATATLSGFNCC